MMLCLVAAPLVEVLVQSQSVYISGWMDSSNSLTQ
jgi:hypothetical protein